MSISCSGDVGVGGEWTATYVAMQGRFPRI
jgi:hypothetical protein